MSQYYEVSDELCFGDVVEAAKAQRLVPFVGAGLSALCGQPTWNEFANQAVTKITRREPSLITYAHADLFSKLSTRTRLSLVEHIAVANAMSREELFGDLFHPHTDAAKQRNQLQLCTDVWKLAKSNLVITTNYDGLLRSTLPVSRDTTSANEPVADGSLGAEPRPQVAPRCGIHCEPELILERASNQKLLIEWHGSVENANGMIVTVGDYVRHYASHRDGGDRPPHLEFLKNVFKRKQVLFIGYGLEEMEILEYVLQKAVTEGERGAYTNRQPPHFLIQGYFRHEKPLVDHLRKYYEGLNIRLLAFPKDTENYAALLSTLAFMAAQVHEVATPTIVKFAEMRALFERGVR